MLRPSQYTVVLDDETDGQVLLFNGYSLALDKADKQIGYAVTAGKIGTLPVETQKQLQDRGHLTHYTCLEETRYVMRLIEYLESRPVERFTPTIVPTYQCNLRCPYCFERKSRNSYPASFNKSMRAEDISSLMTAIDTVGANMKFEDCVLYGGEPLLLENREIVTAIVHGLRQRGIFIRAITNGTELGHYASLLGPDLIAKVQITVDGPSHVHDRRRFGITGEGSFAQIMDNIGCALQTGTEVNVRVNVDRQNAAAVSELVTVFMQRGWSDNDLFTWYCHPLLPGTCPDADRELLVTELNEAVGVNSSGGMIADQEMRLVKRMVSSILSRKPSLRAVFCAARQGYTVFDPAGHIYPCYRIVGQTEHISGRWLPELSLLTSERQPWMKRSLTKIEKCVNCPYVLVCAGGCQYQALVRTGSIEAPGCNGEIPELIANHLPRLMTELEPCNDQAG